MTIPEILQQLEPYTGKFPMDAMPAAIEQREAITPELLRIVEAIAANPTEFAQRGSGKKYKKCWREVTSLVCQKFVGQQQSDVL